MIVVKLVLACATAMPIAIISGLTGASLIPCVATYYIAAFGFLLLSAVNVANNGDKRTLAAPRARRFERREQRMAKEDKPLEDSVKREEPARAKRGVSDDDATAEFPASEDPSIHTKGNTTRKKKED